MELITQLASDLQPGCRLSDRVFADAISASTLRASMRSRLDDMRSVVKVGIALDDLAKAVADEHVAARWGSQLDGLAVAASLTSVLILEHIALPSEVRALAAADPGGAEHVSQLSSETDALPRGDLLDALLLFVNGAAPDDAAGELASALRFCGTPLPDSAEQCVAFFQQLSGLLATSVNLDDAELNRWLAVEEPAGGRYTHPVPVKEVPVPEARTTFTERLHYAGAHPFAEVPAAAPVPVEPAPVVEAPRPAPAVEAPRPAPVVEALRPAPFPRPPPPAGAVQEPDRLHNPWETGDTSVDKVAALLGLL